MPSDVESLKALKSAIIARLTALAPVVGPDVSDQGRSVSWGTVNGLYKQLEDIDEAIMRAESPWLFRSYGHTV